MTELIKDKMTVVLPTYHDDFELLERFLASCAHQFAPGDLEEVIVILNDRYRFLKEFNEIIDRCRFDGFNVRTLWANELHPELAQYDWYSQQLVKILIAEQVRTEWFVIHDCKDYYIDRVTYRHFVDDKDTAYGNINIYRPNVFTSGPGIFEEQYTRAYQVWGLYFPNYKNFTLKYTTPFICRTEYIVDMIKDLKQKFQNVFYMILFLQIDHKPAFTEFALISAYITYRGRLMIDYNTDYSVLGYGPRVTRNKDLRRTHQ
jgi:hypothetical protein